MEGREDYKSILLDMKCQEKEMRLKIRWLMGLPMSKIEQKKLGLSPRTKMVVPEFMLREDDVYYETVKILVKKGFGVCSVEKNDHLIEENVQVSDAPTVLRHLISLLDDMTNRGLYHFAQLLVGGSLKFESTRPKLKKMIEACVSKLIRTKNHSQLMNVMNQLSELLKDPHNFHGNFVQHLMNPPMYYHTAAMKVLNGLEDLPLLTLRAMHRKLRGIEGYIPKMPTKRCGWKRDALIEQVRHRCMELLSEYGGSGKLKEPLAKALVVAGLTSNLILNQPSITEFQKFSPQIEALQNDISKAILLVDKVRFSELEGLQTLLDPNAKVSNRSFRTALRNLLIEYLLECSDIDHIPEYLFKALAIINKASGRPSCRSISEKIEEDTECILSVSAQMNHIVHDLLPEYEFDQDFADAYMEDLEDTDTADGYDGNDHQMGLLQNSYAYSCDSNDQMVAVDENYIIFNSSASSIKRDCSSPVLTPDRRLNIKLEPIDFTGTDSVNSADVVSSYSYWKRKILNTQQDMDVNNLQLENKRSLIAGGSQSGRKINRDGFSSPCSGDENSKWNFRNRQEPMLGSVNPLEIDSFHSVFGEANFMHDEQRGSQNKYLAIQETCDATSIVAYRLIGSVMYNFACVEGLTLDQDDASYLRANDPVQMKSQVAGTPSEIDVCVSVIVGALEEILPTFPESGKEGVRKLMASR